MRSIINIFGLIGLLLFIVGLVMIGNKTTIAGASFGKYHSGEVNEIGGFGVVFCSIFLIGGWYYYNLKR